MELLDSVKNVLIIYEDENNLNEFIEKCKEKNSSAQYTGKTPAQLINETIPLSTYDLVFSGYTSSHGMLHEDRLLAKILKVLKMKCNFAVRALVDAQDNFSKKLVSQLKISGFINISEPVEVALKNDEIDELKKKFDVKTDLKLFEVKCNKADYEVGSFVVLKFGKKQEAKASVWKIDALDDNDESIDPDTLLDEDDLKKPDPSSLRVCGTTGKRKACKDCSCGLAEELEAETVAKNPNPLPKSSCGSCYLGDAFRCATCPYLGMPAFKPGEKIQLAENQLKPDI